MCVIECSNLSVNMHIVKVLDVLSDGAMVRLGGACSPSFSPGFLVVLCLKSKERVALEGVEDS